MVFLSRRIGADTPGADPREDASGTGSASRFDLRSQLASRHVVLRSNTKRVSDTIEESEQPCDVNGLCDLIFLPTRIAQLLHIFRSRTVGCLCNQLDIIKQNALRRCQARFVELTLQNRCNTFIGRSLNTQEVSMAVQSIRAAV